MLLVIVLVLVIGIYLYSNREGISLDRWFPYSYNRYGFWTEQAPIEMDNSQPILYDWTNDDGDHIYRYE